MVVDFGPWGGPLLRACGSTPTTGFALLNQGGWHTTGTEHDGPGFVCRIGYAGFQHGDAVPDARAAVLRQTPPVNAYWAYWQAGPGQTTWSYSQHGAAELTARSRQHQPVDLRRHQPRRHVRLGRARRSARQRCAGPRSAQAHRYAPAIANAPASEASRTASRIRFVHAAALLALAIALALDSDRRLP